MLHLQRQLIDGERISVIPNFLSVAECQQLITRAEENGFNSSPPSGKIAALDNVDQNLIYYRRWRSWSYTSRRCEK